MWVVWLVVACFLMGALAGYFGLITWLRQKLPF